MGVESGVGTLENEITAQFLLIFESLSCKSKLLFSVNTSKIKIRSIANVGKITIHSRTDEHYNHSIDASQSSRATSLPPQVFQSGFYVKVGIRQTSRGHGSGLLAGRCADLVAGRRQVLKSFVK